VTEERNILVTNDDGVDADGVWHLARAMSDFGRVMVVAPVTEQSGAGTMVTQRRDLQIQQVDARVQGVKAYSVDGTPADCVLAGLKHLKEEWISVVASGINHGTNLGTDFFFSGTCGAAMVGGFRGLMSFAISLGRDDDDLEQFHWDTGSAVARTLGEAMQEGVFPEDVFLNVNIPGCSPASLAGIRITEMAPGTSTRLVETRDQHTGAITRRTERYTGHAVPGSDIDAVMNNYVSITPVRVQTGHLEHARLLESRLPRLFDWLERHRTQATRLSRDEPSS
jgi:5'-nucleotidase